MWLWILSALVVALSWGVWFILQPPNPEAGELVPLWIPVSVTVGVVLIVAGILVYRRIRAARAARALEKAIAQQAQEQALNAKPERRAEIQELHRQIQQGINALKASKLGGGRRGADALYLLPWYVMVGPPGVGKTTALRHSGLVFPYLDPAGGGVKGVGGTRNCDWWFTNEAILLDTAGRYTTEAEDHDEWIAFLEQLQRYRPHKPLNGVVVAVSVSELLDATDEQIEQTGRKIRARIDEMQQTLRMVLPVYVMFTKVDLVAGFVEFFGDLKKSERAKPWGATIRLDEDKSDPAKIFEREFDILVEKLHQRGLRRLAMERSRTAKEKIYQFPLEFAAIKRNLSDFLGAAFAGVGAGGPILRGFYFTSGTQEGRPLDRVVGAMGRAFGLRPVAAEEGAGAVEAKSYFLRDVFTEIIFPDQAIAARTEAEARRQRIQRFAAAAAAAVVALLVLVPSIFSYLKNKELIDETARISREAAEVKWFDGGKATDKVEKLEALRMQVEKLDAYRDDRPFSYGWFLYKGDELYRPLLQQYVATLREGFVAPSKERLEEKLRRASGAKYLEDYNNLKTYLLFDDREHLQTEADWETGRLTQQWAEVLRPTTELPEAELRGKLVPHVKYYVDVLKRGEIDGEPLDKPLIDRTRDVLARVGPSQRYYDQFVTVLIDQKYDEGGPATPENLRYPPVTLGDLFADRPEVLTKIRSAQKERSGKWFEVQGPYTAKGKERVLASLAEGYKLLEREKWVVPLTAEEKQQGDKIQQALDRVRQDYDAEYIRQWVNFFRDIQVEIPQTNRDAIAEFRVLSTPDWPYLRLLRTLADNTQPPEKDQLEAQATADGGILDQIKTRVQRKVESRTRVRVSELLPGQKPERYDPVPDKFESMVAFGVPKAPPAPKEGQAPAPPPAPPGLNKYIGSLEQLAGEMGNIEDGPANTDTKKATELFEGAVKEAQALLLTMDATGQELMEPLLLNPLKQAYKAVVRRAGGAASGLWEVVVWPVYRDKIKDRYPFNVAATRDASFDDAVKFFKPKDGVLWGFYEEHLKGFHTKEGHEFVPSSHLEPRPRPAKPFTPFNANLYNCLRRADEITEALWAEGGDKPKVSFQVNLKTVSPIVSEVTFELDGQKRVYRNEKEMWQPFTWPGEKQRGAKIHVRGAGGLDEEIMREGPWGIFRLFEAGTVTAVKDSDQTFEVTWQMTAPPVTVTMEVKPTRGNHPFPTSFFRALNCPPSIGDRFGKGS